MPNLAKVVNNECEQELAHELAKRVVKEKEEHRKAKAEKMEDTLQHYNAKKITGIELEDELLAINVKYSIDDALVLPSNEEAELVDS
jgi:hypothetical protein